MLIALWILCAAVILVAAYALFIEPYSVQIERVERASAHLPAAFDGLRLVFVSDTHFGIFFRGRGIRRLVRLIDAQQPDVVLLGGDITEIPEFGHRFLVACGERLHPRYGIYGVPGNHEYMMARRVLRTNELARQRVLIREMYKDTGVSLLSNDVIQLENNRMSISILGVDIEPGMKRLERMAGGTGYKILVAHSPLPLAQWINSGHDPAVFDLSLAGHTHGGQIFKIGLMTLDELKGVPNVVIKGWKRYGAGYHLTSNGFGLTGMHIRLLARPQIHVVTLRSRVAG